MIIPRRFMLARLRRRHKTLLITRTLSAERETLERPESWKKDLNAYTRDASLRGFNRTRLMDDRARARTRALTKSENRFGKN